MHRSEFTPRLLLYLKKGYSRKDLGADIFAGITVGIIALPLAMAFAIASGVPPERGLFTAIVAGFVVSALGGSRTQIGGPTGAFVVIVYGIVQHHGYQGLATATILAGLLLIALGVARLGRMIKFIPYPVITGFTTGIALIIFSSQVKDFFGLKISALPVKFLEQWVAYFNNGATFSPWATTVGVGSLVTLIAFRRFVPRFPGALLVVVSASALCYYLRLPVETIGTRFGQIPNALPSPSLPPFSFSIATQLIPEALTIALLAGIESLLSAMIADGLTGDRHSSNCELIGQGVANIASIIFGGIPATGAIARTAANVKSGARTPVAGLIHALTLLAFMMIAARFATLIPLSCLAAILFLAAYNMSELDHFRYLLKAPRSDVLVLLSTFLLTVLVDITVAVEVGVVMAALLFMKEMSDIAITSADKLPLDDHLDFSGEPVDPQSIKFRQVPAEVEVFQMSGPFFFGVVDKLKDTLNRVERRPRIFILRMRKVPVIDASGIHALRELYLKCLRQGTTLLLSGVQPRVMQSLADIGLLEQIGRINIRANIDDALIRSHQLLQNKKSGE